jgi:hypothetical protein
MTDGNKFYYQGKYFDKQEDFWAYVKEWGNIELNQETAERLTKTLSKEIVMNAFFTNSCITNNEFSNLLHDTFMFFCARLYGVKVNDE